MKVSRRTLVVLRRSACAALSARGETLTRASLDHIVRTTSVSAESKGLPTGNEKVSLTFPADRAR